jgi:hypothetical protein
MIAYTPVVSKLHVTLDVREEEGDGACLNCHDLNSCTAYAIT